MQLMNVGKWSSEDSFSCLLGCKQPGAANEAVGVRRTAVDGCGELTVKTNDAVRVCLKKPPTRVLASVSAALRAVSAQHAAE